MRFRTLLALAVCLTLPVFAVEENEEEDSIVVYKIKMPTVMPKEKPDADDVANFTKSNKNKKLMELKGDFEQALRDVQTAGGEPDEKKRRRAVERALGKLEALAKKYYRELEKTRKKPFDEFTKLKKLKEQNDRKIEQAEAAGDDKQATRLAQQFDRQNAKYESLQKTLAVIDSFIYFNEFKDIASIVSELELKESSLPEFLKIAETMMDETERAAAQEKKKQAELEDNAADDNGKPAKKARRKKSRRKADAED